MRPTRRRLLQGGAASLLLPRWGAAGAQSGIALLRAPKHALVIGNGGYKDMPLKNPPNDAKAIGETLRQAGFQVQIQQDMARAPMVKAIQDYAAALAKDKAVGLFYFAGHGVQLAWRNFLLPVDAVIDKLEDVKARCVDVGAVIEGITKASNPMNIVILDACRENPFGADYRVEHKGLSQVDAPPGTFLAYATSPGNVASDGAGANGLYTEHLLNELRQPEAKIEDIFKRVRLGVRRKSNGQQIPWESTSLEEDFFFLPPKELKKLSDAEAERLFQAELAIWEKIKLSPDPRPLVDYLEKYPSGRFAELAQLQLDRVMAKLGEKKIQIEKAADNPYTKGTAMADTAFKVGDAYGFAVTDLFSGAPMQSGVETVKDISETEVIYDNGKITDLLGNPIRTRDGRRWTSQQNFVPEYSVGKRWTSRSKVHFPPGHPAAGRIGDVDTEFRVAARESITVPAGTFNAFRIEWTGVISGTGPLVGRATNKYWVAPEAVRVPVAAERLVRVGANTGTAEREVLVSYKQG
jgi:hypothetical protein